MKKPTVRPTIFKTKAEGSGDVSFESAMAWLTTGVDLESRRIELNLPVCDVMAAIVVRSLIKMSEVSHEPIEIYISSYGGEMYEGLAIYDAIRACPCDVHIIASGKLMSAGVLIFLAGDKRVAAPHTTFMVHSASYGSEGKIKDQEISLMEGKRLNNIMLELLGQRTKQSMKWWVRATASHDRYYDVQQATDLGIINPGKSKEKENGTKKTGNKVRLRKATTKVPNKRVSSRNRSRTKLRR